MLAYPSAIDRCRTGWPLVDWRNSGWSCGRVVKENRSASGPSPAKLELVGACWLWGSVTKEPGIVPSPQLPSMNRVIDELSEMAWSTKPCLAHGEIAIMGMRGPRPHRPCSPASGVLPVPSVPHIPDVGFVAEMVPRVVLVRLSAGDADGLTGSPAAWTWSCQPSESS
jgi:hypothetical protein